MGTGTTEIYAHGHTLSPLDSLPIYDGARLAASGLPPGRGEAGSVGARRLRLQLGRSEEHTSELQSLMRISSAVFCLKKTRAEGQAALRMTFMADAADHAEQIQLMLEVNDAQTTSGRGGSCDA